LKIKQKKEVENATLTIYCPKCRKIHPLREFPLDNIELLVYVQKIMLQKILISTGSSRWSTKEINEATEKLCFVAPKIPWHPRTPGISQDPSNNSILIIQINNTPNIIGPFLCLGKHGHHNKSKLNLGNKVGEDLPMEPCLLILILCNNTPNILHKPNIPHKSNKHTLLSHNKPQISQPQQLQLPSNQPLRPTQLPTQPISNPNNKVAQPAYKTELQNFLT
jgi:hypothetical protein